ncbi:MAG: Asp-tRNA(Asn)/Glu-tRNA(Gln) amidotransferase subunit GatB [bacterium]|nr:Asp-tRNA(Asn)/Glu-tRNA(Gln) amidotransferase subunit GatB [bacterium]
MKNNQQPVIGLEIHVELKTKSKMFCDCLNDSLERHPNVNVCPVCLGHPGVLPVINGDAVKMVIKTGLALGCQIPEYSKFDRKNYFYPDLPKGYQISQYDKPLCLEGTLNGIRIRRVHLEEDTGRLVHPKGADYSLIDFNRAGVPLMELVTEPDLTSAEEARRFAEELQLIFRYLGVSSADMEKGEMRVEVNISLKGGAKVEVKNLNSFKAVEGAINYEIKRQKEEKAVLETRGWDDIKGKTFSQRMKEEAKDYRYFPEPDLPPLRFTNDDIKKIQAEIPEIPQQRRERFKTEYGLEASAIDMFTRNKDLGEYFEKVISELEPKLSQTDLSHLVKLTSNYLISDLQGLLKGSGVFGEDFLITPENFADFIALIHEGKISSKIAKLVLTEMFAKGGDPSHIIEEKGLAQITDESEIENIVKEVIFQNPKPAEDFKNGKENALQFLVGQVMVKSHGKASPQAVRQMLLTKLK